MAHARTTRTAGERTNLYEQITSRIIAELEAGRVPWAQPWGSSKASAAITLVDEAATVDRGHLFSVCSSAFSRRRCCAPSHCLHLNPASFCSRAPRRVENGLTRGSIAERTARFRQRRLHAGYARLHLTK